MPRRLLTAQDAFVGVRSPALTAQSPETTEVAAPTDAPAPPDEGATALSEAAPEHAHGREETPRARRLRRSAEQATTVAPEDLTAALREAQEVLPSKGPIERLTLYLPPDLAEQLANVWSAIRETTQAKVGKSAIATVALRMVLTDPVLQARAAIAALRERTRRSA
jgi:hypothetical protein